MLQQSSCTTPYWLFRPRLSLLHLTWWFMCGMCHINLTWLMWHVPLQLLTKAKFFLSLPSMPSCGASTRYPQERQPEFKPTTKTQHIWEAQEILQLEMSTSELQLMERHSLVTLWQPTAHSQADYLHLPVSLKNSHAQLFKSNSCHCFLFKASQ